MTQMGQGRRELPNGGLHGSKTRRRGSEASSPATAVEGFVLALCSGSESKGVTSRCLPGGEGSSGLGLIEERGSGVVGTLSGHRGGADLLELDWVVPRGNAEL